MVKLSQEVIASAVNVAGNWTLAVIEYRNSENYTETEFNTIFQTHFKDVLASVEMVLSKHQSP